MSGEFVYTAGQQPGEIGTVEVNVGGFIDSEQTTDRRKQIDQSGWGVFNVSFCNRARSTKDPRNTNTAFKIGTLFAA